MTTQPHDGGRRPIDRILATGFASDLTALDLDELRARRQLAEQEEVDLSYARRLLQGRTDLLSAERERRQGADDAASQARSDRVRSDQDLARDLGAALADDAPRLDHGLGRHLSTDPSRVGEHRRAAEQAVADVRGNDPAGLAANELDAAVARLGEIEQAVSESRHRVQAVMDLLTAEVARRYRDGEARVEDVLTVE
jgi:hypothetical protein